MDSTLADLIRDGSSGQGVVGASFVSFIGNKSIHKVKQNKLAAFLDGYCQLAYEDEQIDDYKKQKQLYLGEVIDKRTLPVYGSFVLKFENLDEDSALFDDIFLMEVTRCFQQAITELIEVSTQASELICCIQESPPWRMANKTSIQVQWQFPYCQIDIEFQKKTLRPRVLGLLRSRKVASYLDAEPIGDWTDIIQPITDSFPLYRSSSELGRPHMTLTHIYHLLEDRTDEKYQPTNLVDELDNVYKPEHHSFIFQNKISSDFVSRDDVDTKFFLPLFLSINFWGSEARVKTADQDNTIGDDHKFDNIDTDDPLEIASHLLPLLSSQRVEKEHYWLDVGRVLFNITKGGEEGLNRWIHFSSKHDMEGRDARSCRMKYPRISDTIVSHQYMSIKTIAWFAKEDSPSAYANWHEAWCQSALRLATTALHEDVARAVYRAFWLNYICTGMSKSTWWRFDNTCFKPMDDAVNLRKDLTTKFIPIYEKMRADISRELYEDLQGNESQKKQVEVQIQEITSLIKKLKTESYKSTLIKSCRQFFYQTDKFSDITDRDPDKLACVNLVIELCEGKAYPRKGKPEDFITVTTGIRYEEFSWDDPLVKELLTWLGQVFVDNELLKYFLKDASSFLRAKNAEKRFRIWTGMGDNSKSMIVKLFQYTFGNKCVDFPLSLICGKQGFASSGPTPELAQSKNACVGFICEPESDEEIRTGAVKKFTGGDRFFARACNENGGSIEAYFKLVLMCNRIPDFSIIDKAFESRVDILPYLSSWVDNPPTDEKEQYKLRTFKKDPFFDKRLPELSYPFLWLLVQYFPLYSAEGLKRPQIVVDTIQKHMENNDTYRMFIIDRIEPVYKLEGEKKLIDESVSVSATEIYNVFKSWYRELHGGSNRSSPPDFNRFKEELCMNTRLGPQVNRRWIGIKINLPIAAQSGIFQQ